jgi:membrane protease YdiL (CAAX protease family)
MNKNLQSPIIRIIIAVLLISIGIAIGQTLLNLLRTVFSVTNIGLANLLSFVMVMPVTYFAYWAYVRYIEKRELTELGRVNAAREFGIGTLIGFGLFSFVIVVLWLSGLYRVNGIDFVLSWLIGALFGAFVSAFAQELIFRGVIYRITEEWMGTWWAVAISAVLFGMLHLTSAGATIFSTIAIALQAGLILAATYTLTHRLWMPIGLHMAWDFANDGVFGVGVAGQSGQSLHGLLRASLHGPDLMTGGTFGVEASLITLVIVLIAGILMLRLAYQKNLFITGNTSSQRSAAHSASGKISP